VSPFFFTYDSSGPGRDEAPAGLRPAG